MQHKAYQEAQKAISQGIWVNILLAMGKIFFGVTGNSFALVADGIESITDVFSSFLLLLGIKYAHRPPDDDHPYGHGRAEPLLTFVVVLFLIVAASVILYRSVYSIFSPQTLPEIYTLYLLGGIILVKELLFRRLIKKGKKTKSTALVADAWHHRSDAITSLAAFVGISIALVFDYPQADDWAAIVAACIIYYNAYLIFRPALGEIMDENLHPQFIQKIKQKAESHPEVIATEKCFVRKQGMQFVVDLHLVVSGDISVRKGHEIAHQVKERLMNSFPEIINVLIHVEPNE